MWTSAILLCCFIAHSEQATQPLRTSALDAAFYEICNGDFYKGAFYTAACNGDFDKAKRLLKAGGSVNARGGNYNATALMTAASSHQMQTARFLIAHGAGLDMQDNDGWTALVYAARYNATELGVQLIEAGADLVKESHQGNTALITAAQNNVTELGVQLIEAGADLDKQNHYGYTALMDAIHEGNEFLVQELPRRGANVRLQVNSGLTALHLVADNDAGMGFDDTRSIAKVLLDKGADIDARNLVGQTPLMQAAKDCDIQQVEFLVHHGADYTMRDAGGASLVELVGGYWLHGRLAQCSQVKSYVRRLMPSTWTRVQTVLRSATTWMYQGIGISVGIAAGAGIRYVTRDGDNIGGSSVREMMLGATLTARKSCRTGAKKWFYLLYREAEVVACIIFPFGAGMLFIKPILFVLTYICLYVCPALLHLGWAKMISTRALGVLVAQVCHALPPLETTHFAEVLLLEAVYRCTSALIHCACLFRVQTIICSVPRTS